MLMEPANLESALERRELRILDSRSLEDYRAARIPGAVHVDVEIWKDLVLSEGGLHDAEAWAKEVGRLGIDKSRAVVVYGTRVTDTARVWWTLKYLGLENVSMLNGGWDAWKAENRPSETAVTGVSPARFEPVFQPGRVAEIGELKGSLDSEDWTFVDTRSTDEFTGAEVRGARGGRIPGAVHLEWKHLLADDGRFKSPEALRRLFDAKKIVRGNTLVTY